MKRRRQDKNDVPDQAESRLSERIISSFEMRPTYRSYADLEGYMFHLKKYPPLKDQAMYDFLFTEYHSGNESRSLRARDLLVYGNIRLVLSVALRYTGRGMPLLDLLQEGAIGVMRAIEKYDPARGHRFSTYATWWIRQSIVRAIRDRSTNTIYRIPVHVQEAMNLVRHGLGELYLESGRWPSDLKLYEWIKNYESQVAERICLADMVRIRREIESGGNKNPEQLDAPVSYYRGSKGGEEEAGTLGDITPAPLKTETVLDARKFLAEYQSALNRIEEAIDTLPTRTATIIRLRLGLGDFEAMTLEEIGQRYELTRERIRQIEAKGFETLQESLDLTPHQVSEIINIKEELEGIAHAI